MTDWDQLGAMGQLAGMRQREAIAKQQAARDAQLAAQNAELVALLKEQKAREDAAQARLEAMPKCPDCKTPVEVGSRRCPQCHIEIISWDYSNEPFSWRLICRAEEAEGLLQKRCNNLLKDIGIYRDQCLESLEAVNTDWQSRCEAASGHVWSTLKKFNAESQATLQRLLSQVLSGKRLATPKDEEALRQARLRVESLPLPCDAPEETEYAPVLQVGAVGKLAGYLAVLSFLLVLLSGVAIPVLWCSNWWSATTGASKDVVPLGRWVIVFCVALVVSVISARTAEALKTRALIKAAPEIAEENKRRQAKAKSRQEMRTARAEAEVDYQKKVEAVDQAWRTKLEANGLLPALNELAHLLASGDYACSQAKRRLEQMMFIWGVLADTRNFAKGVGVTLRISGMDSDESSLGKALKSFPEPAIHFTAADIVAGEEKGVAMTAKCLEEVRTALRSLPL